jgi:hypothetical protein
MKNIINKAIEKMKRTVTIVSARTGYILKNRSGEAFIDTAVKILMSVVIGALILSGIYLLFKDNILPGLSQRITDMFNFNG